ncbi:hypothetical protein JTE90_012100 [Oedothorax gibbosus]|uniref:MATH domain-containing protein n=1 Tax=Oedothorax gibbosus TaxID=931172 RepID=A0AAV6TK76_9ARAC|nr:hypothetical protein JTE90_012100 [Oedothorax gibbosus]
MNSKKSNLETGELKECQEFTFTWSIHNYNFCTLEEDKYIESPEFVVDFLGDATWCLWLYPKGDYARGFVSCYLLASGKVFACYFTLSIRKSNGEFKEADKMSFDEHCTENGCSEFISHEELNGPDVFLLNDTFTIQCRIFKMDTDVPSSVNCYADSRIKILKLNYDWTLKDIEVSNQNSDKTTDITHCFGKIPSLKMHVLNFGFFDEDAIHFKLEMGAREERFYFVVCLIHVLDADGRVVHSARGDHLFKHSKTTEHWNFPLISKDKLYLNKNMYLPKGRLTLRCEISFSSDNQLENFNYRKTYVTETKKTDVLEQDQDVYIHHILVELDRYIVIQYIDQLNKQTFAYLSSY